MYLSLARDFIFSSNWSAQLDPYLYSLNNSQLVWQHEYLSYILFYTSWLLLGAKGLILLKTLTLGLMFWIALKEYKNNSLWDMLWILAILAASFRFIERSSTFSDLFTVLTAYLLLNHKKISVKLIATLSILFFLWIQFHPGFVTGVVFILVWSCFYARSKKAFFLFIPILCLIINPNLVEGVLYPIRFSIYEAQNLKNYNFEWFPIYHKAFRFAPEVIAFWILSISCFFLLITHKAFKTINFWFSTLAFILCLQAVRFIPWTTMVLILCVRPYTNTLLSIWNKPILKNIVSGTLILVIFKNILFGYQSSSGYRNPNLTFDSKFFPSTTLEVLKTHPIPGRLYNSHDLGSSLIWYGLTPIFHHGFVTDMDFYKNDVIGAVSTSDIFFQLASKYNWTMLLVDKNVTYRSIHRILSPFPDWKIVAEDDAAYLIYKMPKSP